MSETTLSAEAQAMTEEGMRLAVVFGLACEHVNGAPTEQTGALMAACAEREADLRAHLECMAAMAWPAVVEAGPWTSGISGAGRHYVESDDFTHDVRLWVGGDFADDDSKASYCAEIARRLNSAHQSEQRRAPLSDAEVTVERDRVWIKRGNQSFMLAYESDEPTERDWYADQLRAALAAFTPRVKTAPQAQPAREPTYRPRGGMCTACLAGLTKNCSALQFADMPVISQDPDGTLVVLCTEFQRIAQGEQP